MLEQHKEVLEQNGVDKIFFYYEDSPLAKNIHTTCLFINTKEKKIVARGVSICSLLDTFSRKKGKNKSIGRALKALIHKNNFFEINTSGREQEIVTKTITIKDEKDHEQFLNKLISEISLLNKPVTIFEPFSSHEKYIKKYKFNIPANYPIEKTGRSFRYKSEFSPEPVNDFEIGALST